MDIREFIVKADISGGTYPIPPCDCAIRPGLLMENRDAKFRFRGDVIVAELSTNTLVWLYKPSIMVVGISYG